MPSIINLKFKGNKSFVPFSNLSDADSLTKTWKVCTKVASFLEQGQRLENLSWRLWHLQNLMVDTDNAKSKREFRKLSKCMSDKLDKEKGRSIEELQAPGFRRNHSTDMIQQRAAEKEREREANHDGRTLHRMQFTFSVDQPAPPTASAAPAKKPDLKPSPEFKDTILKRGRPTTRSAAHDSPFKEEGNDKDPPLTQRGRKPSSSNHTNSDDNYSTASLRFPSLFSNDFGPSALLYPTPTLTNAMTYGEGVASTTSSDGFSIVRPTIELPLDELLNADSPGGWSSSISNDTRSASHFNPQEDVEMKTAVPDTSFSVPDHHQTDQSLSAPMRSIAAVPHVTEDLVPRTITPSRLGPEPTPLVTTPVSSSKRPSLHLRTNSVSTRSSGPSATPVNSSNNTSQNNSAPGGVKAECSNCGATHTPLWRRGLNDELNCNACGLYCKLHKRPRPKSMRNNHGEGRSQAAPRQESQEVVVAQCYNCHTTATPLWRKDDEGKTVCNACGLYYKLHGSARPISMKSDVIRKRARHDARRSGGNVSETPSASPGASRRASPTGEGTPTLAPDSTTQQVGYDEGNYNMQQSELMTALGTNGQNGPLSSDGTFNHQYNSYSTFPGPYHPDYMNQHYHAPSDSFPFSSGDSSDYDGSETRSVKRRRMSNDSASEPPSSAVSFSSFSDFSSTSSVSSHSQRSSMEFPFSSYSSYNLLRGNEDSPMDFLHPPMHQDETDALFATYLHPPMLPPEDSPKVSIGSLHPPMLPQDWPTTHHDFYDSSMHTY
ncbi:GATA-type domain-containing protein [Abortiporus biennis]